MFGEIDDGGLMRLRVSGLTIGIAFLVRIAEGWWRWRLFMANVVGGETYEAPDKANDGPRWGCIWCCNGELSGEALANDDRSEEPDVMD